MIFLPAIDVIHVKKTTKHWTRNTLITFDIDLMQLNFAKSLRLCVKVQDV